MFLSSNDELCCSTTANILIRRENQWITPRLESGCLPGVMRQQGLDSGLIKEAEISDKPSKGDQWLLINSLSCKPINKVDTQSLSIFQNPQELWLSLLDKK